MSVARKGSSAAGSDARGTSLAALLADARIARGLSFEALAGQTGLSKAYVHKVAVGKVQRPSEANLGKLAKALGLPMREVLRAARNSRVRANALGGASPEVASGPSAQNGTASGASWTDLAEPMVEAEELRFEMNQRGWMHQFLPLVAMDKDSFQRAAFIVYWQQRWDQPVVVKIVGRTGSGHVPASDIYQLQHGGYVELDPAICLADPAAALERIAEYAAKRWG